MNKNTIATLRADINAALAEVAKKHGLSKLAATSCKYMDTSCNFTLEAVEEGGLSKEGERYKLHTKLLNLPPLGTEVTIGKDVWTPTGLNTTGTKAMVTKAADGKSYLYPVESLSKAWLRQESAKTAAATIQKAAA